MAFSKQITKQVQRMNSVVSHIKGRDFKTALQTLGTDLSTAYSKYLAGFALVHSDQPERALALWWPLVNSHRIFLQTDCKILGTHIFTSSVWSVGRWRLLPMKELIDLLTAALALSLNSPEVTELKKFVSDKLILEKNWLVLQTILKSSQNPGVEDMQTRAQVEFALIQKSGIDPFYFASLILTAGANFLSAHRKTHQFNLSEDESLLSALATEIGLSIPMDDKTTDSKGLSTFMYFEIQVLLKMLQSATNSGQILLSPGYFNSLGNEHDLFDLRSHFLNDLAADSSLNSEMASYYSPEYFKSVQSLCRIQYFKNKSDSIQIGTNQSLNAAAVFQNILALSNPVKLDNKLTLPTKSKNLKNNLFHEVALLTCESCIMFHANNRKPTNLSDSAYKQLIEIALFFERSDWSDFFKNQQVCRQTSDKFVDHIKNTKKRDWEKILKNEKTVQEHFILISDFLKSNKESLINNNICRRHIFQFIEHVKQLDFNSSQTFKSWEGCNCDGCYNTATETILRMTEQWKSNSTNPINLSMSFSDKKSVFRHDDPFAILGISPMDSKSTVLKAVMKLMAQSPQKMSDWRTAQDLVFHSEIRFMHLFLKYKPMFMEYSPGHTTGSISQQLILTNKNNLIGRNVNNLEFRSKELF